MGAKLRGLGISWGAERIACGTPEARLIKHILTRNDLKKDFFLKSQDNNLLLFFKNKQNCLIDFCDKLLLLVKKLILSFADQYNCPINIASEVPQAILSAPQLIPRPLNLASKAPPSWNWNCCCWAHRVDIKKIITAAKSPNQTI